MYTKYFTQLDLRGHECERRNELDELLNEIPGESVGARIQQWWLRRRLISPTNYRSYKYMRSKSAINYERTRQIRQYHGMIHPFSDFRAVYEIIMSVIYVITLFYQPIEVLFDMATEPTPISTPIHYAILTTDVISLLAIIINFRTGHLVVNTKEVYMSSRYAAMSYFKGFFLLDLLSAIPYHTVEQWVWSGNKDEAIGAVIDALSILRCLRVISALHFYRNTVEVFDIDYVISKLIRMSFLMTLFLHWSGCTHYLVANLVQGRIQNCPTVDPESWIKNLCEASKSYPVVYLESTLRSFSNSFKTGYGHDAPLTTEDMIVTTICMLLGNLFTICCTATIMHLINNDHSAQTKYSEMTMQLNGYMHHKKLTPTLQDKIITYYDFRFHRSFYREDEIMSSITIGLKQEIMLHNCQRLVENVSFFNNIPMSMMIRIVSTMKSEFYLANDVILKYGNKGDSMYFIKTGTVAVYTDEGVEVCHLEDGAHFGEIALVLPGDRRVANVIAVESSLLYRLDKLDFQKAVAPFPDLLSRIKHIAKTRLTKTEEMQSLSRSSSFERNRTTQQPKAEGRDTSHGSQFRRNL